MTKIRVINDIHLFGVNPCMSTNDMIDATKVTWPVYLAGDIVDIANCKYKDLPNATVLLNLLTKKFKNAYAFGNHELNIGLTENYLYLFNNKVLIMHGDYAMWGMDKANKFRQQSHGAGWFKRNVISKTIDSLRHLLTVRPNNNLKEFIRQTKKDHPSLQYAIMGHSHPLTRIEFTEANVMCVILPRGINDCELDV